MRGVIFSFLHSVCLQQIFRYWFLDRSGLAIVAMRGSLQSRILFPVEQWSNRLLKTDTHACQINLTRKRVKQTRLHVNSHANVSIFKYIFAKASSFVSKHTLEGDFIMHECDFSTQSVIFTRSCVITTRMSVILIRSNKISTRRVRFSHTKCDFDTFECHFHIHKCDLDTLG
jgi:hypothetical protein